MTTENHRPLCCSALTSVHDAYFTGFLTWAATHNSNLAHGTVSNAENPSGSFSHALSCIEKTGKEKNRYGAVRYFFARIPSLGPQSLFGGGVPTEFVEVNHQDFVHEKLGEAVEKRGYACVNHSREKLEITLFKMSQHFRGEREAKGEDERFLCCERLATFVGPYDATYAVRQCQPLFSAFRAWAERSKGSLGHWLKPLRERDGQDEDPPSHVLKMVTKEFDVDKQEYWEEIARQFFFSRSSSVVHGGEGMKAEGEAQFVEVTEREFEGKGKEALGVKKWRCPEHGREFVVHLFAVAKEDLAKDAEVA